MNVIDGVKEGETLHLRIRPSRRGVFKTPIHLQTFYAFIRSICPTTQMIITPISTAAVDTTTTTIPIITPTTSTTGITVDDTESIHHKPTFFTLDIIAFKRGIFMGAIDPFMNTLANEYYHERCRFYAERSMSTPAAYAQFVQVIRHICKGNGIAMISSLKYEQSQSNKVYHIELMREYEINE